MLFYKETQNKPQFKDLMCLRLELTNYVIGLYKDEAEIYKEKCKQFGYQLITIDKALIKFNNDNMKNLKDKKDLIINKKKKEIKVLNKKRCENNNQKSENKCKNSSKYLILPKNGEDYFNGNIIAIEEIYKMLKYFDDKNKTKKDKKIVPDKIKMPLEQINFFRNGIKKRIQNLSLTQIKEINNKYFNSVNDQINIELLNLSQEQLKRLQIDIEQYENLNKYNPNFINYIEELRRRIPDNKKIDKIIKFGHLKFKSNYYSI